MSGAGTVVGTKLSPIASGFTHSVTTIAFMVASPPLLLLLLLCARANIGAVDAMTPE